MRNRMILTGAALLSMQLSGCSTDATGITTSSVDAKLTPAAAPASAKVDPTCVTLKSQIDTLRKEGVVDRLEKVSAGKTSTVNVKRASLAKVAELDKANAEFQAKCSTIQPGSQQAQAAAPSPIATAATSAASNAAASAASSAAAKASDAAVSAAVSKASGAAPKLP